MKKKDLILLALCLALAVFGTVQLISHFSEERAGRQREEQLRELWHAETATPIPTMAPQRSEAAAAPAQAEAAPEEARTELPAPAATAEPRITRLKRSMYPGNPGLTVSERFRALRKTNRDIVGWLSIGRMQDEAVVQRDNEFYMDHDASGKKNVSGALFLDENISLQMRPYTLILYGHNMRDESRFGWLRKYENPEFCRNNRFIDFQTLYEEGRYVVFSEGRISTEEGNPDYLDFFCLSSLRTDERAQAIGVLEQVSMLDGAVDVQVDDQILLLVTCTEKDTDRRIVAARRIRDGEDETKFRSR